ncbi:MAG: pyridoxamine 5'-phosphate oxidase family protein [Oculatellaceae cyanobacterium Prado106]|jgi:general stress protein 26|nr:pyridoxamine 5'-phosphate oxidase family protein [Oculatellaceae cyanobacterium Prado106]
MIFTTEQTDSIHHLQELIQDIEYGMFVTVDEGHLRSRPMANLGTLDPDAVLWFFTDATSHKVYEVEHQHQVNISFSAPEKQQYVSLSGMAELVRDRPKMQELWQPELKAWFPQELNEPDIALLKVSIEQAEYWDASLGWAAKAIGFNPATVRGRSAPISKDAKVYIE